MADNHSTGEVRPNHAPAASDAEESTKGFIYLGTAVNWVLGLDEDAETPPDGQAIRREILSARKYGAWPVRMLDRRDRVLFRGIDQIYEYVHFGDFARWVFEAKLPMSSRLKKTKSGTLSEWLEVIRRERAYWSSDTVDMAVQDQKLKELGDEEGAITKVLEEGSAAIPEAKEELPSALELANKHGMTATMAESLLVILDKARAQGIDLSKQYARGTRKMLDDLCNLPSERFKDAWEAGQKAALIHKPAPKNP